MMHISHLTMGEVTCVSGTSSPGCGLGAKVGVAGGAADSPGEFTQGGHPSCPVLWA